MVDAEAAAMNASAPIVQPLTTAKIGGDRPVRLLLAAIAAEASGDESLLEDV